MGGGSKAPATTTTIQKTELPAWLEGVTKENLAIADTISKRPYEAYGGQTIAGFSPEQEQAFRYMQEGVGMTDPLYQRATGVTSDVAGYQPTSFLNANLSGYMNPFTQNVEDRAIDAANRSLRQATNRIGDQARAAGAFGGSRQGIAEGVAAAEAATGVGDLSARLRSDAFNQAATQFGADQARAAQAAQLRLGAANQLGSLAGLQQASRIQDASLLEQIGMQRQGMDQARLDDAYNRYLEQRNYPIEMLNLRLGATSATPYGGTSTTTSTAPRQSGNGLLTGLGAAGTVASIGASLATIF
jgi:hypothetical protein